MSKKKKSYYTDFYKDLKSIPVLKISDYKKNILFKQRENFYNSINININYFKDKKILEIGPGNGVNAFYLLNNKIKHITLVDNNRSALNECRKILKKFKSKVTFINQDIFEFNTNTKFDYIICENILPNFSNPEVILKKLKKNLVHNGYLVFTCSDNFGLFSEKLRGIISKLILSKYDFNSYNKKFSKKNLSKFSFETKILRSEFKLHLNKLKSNTRKIDSWIQDNVLNDKWWTGKKYLAFDKAVNFLSGNKKIDTVFWSSSPNFNANFTWYKKRNYKEINNLALKSYENNLLNFIDIREKYPNINLKIFLKIKDNISKSCLIINKAKISKKNIQDLTFSLEKINNDILKISDKNKTYGSLNSLIMFFKKYINYDIVDRKILIKFHPMWGNGTMAVAFLKKDH